MVLMVYRSLVLVYRIFNFIWNFLIFLIFYVAKNERDDEEEKRMHFMYWISFFNFA